MKILEKIVETTNISRSELENLEKIYGVSIFIDTDKDLYSYEYIEITSNDSSKIYKLPKLTTIDWIIKKIKSHLNQVSFYGNISKKFNNLIKDSDINTYPTSYGVGIHIASTSELVLKKKLKLFFGLLDSYNIKYRLEYSKALWVYKIIISKSKENIAKIERI